MKELSHDEKFNIVMNMLTHGAKEQNLDAIKISIKEFSFEEKIKMYDIISKENINKYICNELNKNKEER